MIDPDVSDPTENDTNPAAVAAAGPDDEPPLQKSRFHGVRPGPVNDASASLYPKPPANSTIANFASNTAPASPRPLVHDRHNRVIRTAVTLQTREIHVGQLERRDRALRLQALQGRNIGEG